MGMMSGGFVKPKEPSLNILLRSNLWNPVKTINFLYDPLWSLKVWNGDKGLGEPLRSFTKNFIKIWQHATEFMLNGFNGGWAVLDVLCSLIDWLIHWLKRNQR